MGAKVADSVLLAKRSILDRRLSKSFTLRCFRSYRVVDSTYSCRITRLVVVLVTRAVVEASVVIETKLWMSEVWEENTLEEVVRSAALVVTSITLVIVSWATVLTNGVASVFACAKAKTVDLLIFSC